MLTALVSVSLLGFIVGREQLQADPVKVKAVVDWPVPSDRRHLKRFLGFTSFYQRFIRGFNGVASLLISLTSHKHPFQWNSADRFRQLSTTSTFSLNLTEVNSSQWKRTPQIQVWEQSSPNKTWKYSSMWVFFPLITSRLQRETTTLEVSQSGPITRLSHILMDRLSMLTKRWKLLWCIISSRKLKRSRKQKKGKN